VFFGLHSSLIVSSSHSKDIMLPLQSGGLSRDDYTALGGDVGYNLARKLFNKEAQVYG
jgi:hypothetical protein